LEIDAEANFTWRAEALSVGVFLVEGRVSKGETEGGDEESENRAEVAFGAFAIGEEIPSEKNEEEKAVEKGGCGAHKVKGKLDGLADFGGKQGIDQSKNLSGEVTG
jgi:hypothetical protein